MATRASNTPNKPQFRSDDIIIVFFALLGIIGSVVLYQTTSAPPIIVSFFLATGVSSLVYRYLGGIQGASITWGAVKLTGTAAALVGIALGVNKYLEVQTLELVSAEGRYDWQFAGGGWKGYLQVEKDGSVSTHMIRYMQCDGVQKIVPLLQQAGKASVKEIDNRTRLHISIPVKFANYDQHCNQTGLQETTTLVGSLTRRAAFAGEVEYQNSYGSSLGGMFIVKNNE
jgi:hypothetical protein